MTPSDDCRNFIQCFERLRLHAYQVQGDVPTIGWGHTSHAGPPAVHLGMTVSRDEADRIFAADLARFAAPLAAMLREPVAQHEFDALVSLAFNVGLHGFPTLLKAFNAGDHDKAARQFLNYDHYAGHVSAGLLRRRRAEQAMFRGDLDTALKLARQ